MHELLRCVPRDSIITGWDFGTGAVKSLAFDLRGNVVAEVRLPTDLWTEEGVSELNVLQLEGQARATTRAMAQALREQNRLEHWVAGGISATHHTAGRLDAVGNPVRRAIYWNDQTLAEYHAIGMARLAAQGLDPVELTGGPWAIRYSLSHLVKDEALLAPADWVRTKRILSHGSLAAGFLTGRFDSVSVSSAASTGIMDLRTRQWRAEMLQALDSPIYRAMALAQLPRIERDDCAPIGLLSPNLAQEAGIAHEHRPMIFPTSDDQQAGLVGGGAVDAGQLAVILGNSAVVNSSSSSLPQSSALDAMRLNWGPYLWMRCYTNGAQFLDHVVGRDADFEALEYLARQVPAGCNGVMVLPFVYAEPSLNVATPYLKWIPAMPTDPGVRYRAALEALAYLIAVGVYEHEHAGQKISRVTMSGGIARSELMGEILATVAHRPMERIASAEGPALGAAVTALSALETHLRRQRGIHEPFSVADAVASMVQFRGTVNPREDSRRVYAEGLQRFRNEIGHLT